MLCWQADTNPCDFHTRDAESERKGQGIQDRGEEEMVERKCKGEAGKRWQLTRSLEKRSDGRKSHGESKSTISNTLYNSQRGPARHWFQGSWLTDCRHMSDKQRNERMGLDCRRIQQWKRMPWVGVSAEQQGRRLGGWSGPLSKKGLGLSQDFHNGIKAERGG